MRTAMLMLCLLIGAGTGRAELLRVKAIVNTGSTFFMAYEDNQVWQWGGPPHRLGQVDRGGISIRDMKRWSCGEAVAVLYVDEQIWFADVSHFEFVVDARRDGTDLLYMDAGLAPQIVCTYADGQVWIWTDGIWRREESMEREVPVPPPPNASVVRLAFYGWNDAPVECFDETVSDTLSCYLPNMVGPEMNGSPYYFGFISVGTERICYIPGDTEPDSTCTYDLTAWFEPGAVAIGHVVGPGGNDQAAMIQGFGWQGHPPTDFTDLRVELQQRDPCNSIRTVIVPIRWYSDAPASVEEERSRTAAFPNPAPHVCRIPYHNLSNGLITVEIVDATGRIARHLLDGSHPAGDYSLMWDGRDDAGRELPAGVYFTHVTTGQGTATGRVVLAR